MLQPTRRPSDGDATVSGVTWSYTITGLVEGVNGITVTAMDTAGNTAGKRDDKVG